MLRSELRASFSACCTASSELFYEVPISTMIFTTAMLHLFPIGLTIGAVAGAR